MPFVPKDLTGRLFDNRADRRNKSQPDYAGTVSIHGEVFRIVGWYNPPSEKSPTATIGLALENYDDYKRRRDNQDAAPPRDARTEAPPIRNANAPRTAPAAPTRADSGDLYDPDDDIPF
jgi:hypothetical protein